MLSKFCRQNHTLILANGSEPRISLRFKLTDRHFWDCAICQKRHNWKRESWTCSQNMRLDNGGDCNFNVCRKCKDRPKVCSGYVLRSEHSQMFSGDPDVQVEKDMHYPSEGIVCADNDCSYSCFHPYDADRCGCPSSSLPRRF